VTAAAPTFFIDKCLTGARFRKALLGAGLRVESLEKHLPENSPDADWIPLVSAPPFEWVIVTKDKAILSNPHEFDQICDYRARVVMFPDQDLTAQQMSERFLAHLPAVLDALRTRAAPLVILLNHDGIQVFPPA
jgi:PIN like domain